MPPREDDPDTGTFSPDSNSTESDVGDVNATDASVSGNETDVSFEDNDDTNTTASVYNQTGDESVTEAPTPAVRRRRN